jgi:hypothetical protein
MKTAENTIVAFHIGRGGRFNNPGFLTFLGENEIGRYTDNLFSRYENQTPFKDRWGYNSTHNDQECIIDLMEEKNFEELEEKFGITEEMLGEEMYYDGGNNPVGLTQNEVDSGIGRIDIDGGYDTTYTKLLINCSEKEIDAIRNSDDYYKNDFLEMLGETTEEEE